MIEIKNKADCCGCTACASICPKNCIEMRVDEEGFLYPLVEASACVDCRACERACPIIQAKLYMPTVSNIKVVADVPFKQKGYVVQNKNPQVLRESTAGGAFTAIAKYVINRGGVVFGVELSDDLIARHVYIDTENDLSRFRNSKYVQSYLGGVYGLVKSFLKQGRFVCFSGTPCQIEGLKRYLGKEHENLITVDVVCRAVPSPLIFRKYVELQEKKLSGNIKTVRFRDKHYGYKYSTVNVITDRNQGNYHQGIDSDPWLRAFFSNICDRPSCHDCKFRKQHRVSDFTLWDCLNIDKFSRDMDNDKGATRVLVHSHKGHDIFDAMKSDFIWLEVEPDKLVKGSKEIFESVPAHVKRKQFFIDASCMNGEELFTKYFPDTLKVRLEHAVRMAFFKMGIYKVAKKAFVKMTRRY